MSEKQYISVTGFVYAGPYDREVNVNGDAVSLRDFMMASSNTNKKIRVTLWPNRFGGSPVEIGDFVAVSGEYTTFQGKEEVNNNISANKFLVLGHSDETPKEAPTKTTTKRPKNDLLDELEGI